MSVIYKYRLAPVNKQILMVPPMNGVIDGVERRFRPSEQVLHLEVQNGVPTVWLLCDRDLLPAAVEVTTAVTGVEFDEQGLHHIGSYQLHNGTFVGHVFMV